MRPSDVQECVQIIAAHPIVGSRYGSAIRDLQSAWLGLLRSEAIVARVFEAVEGSQIRMCFVGVSVFVTDDFVRELKTPPLFWFGPELAKRIMRGDSPILDNKQFRDANASAGLNAMVWEGCRHLDFNDHPELARLTLDVFIETHRGFRLKELIAAQIESPQRLKFVLKTGAFLWDPENRRYIDSLQGDPGHILKNPHLVGVTRDLERSRGPWDASWVGKLFDYHPPRCRFSRSEQRLLELALAGEAGTNEELAHALSIALPTVKKLWSSIYGRVADSLPELNMEPAPGDKADAARGKEKKRPLLAYLREHPEELRPVSYKLLD